MLRGSDIASYQGNVDCDALKSASDFVITKVTENNNYINPYFARIQSEARRVGLLLGYYHFARPSETSPQIQADYFVDAIGVMNPGEILVLDYEIDFPGDTDAWCYGFLKRVEDRTGVKGLIYLNQSLANMYPWARTIAGGYGLWLAQYDGSPDGINQTPWTTTALKQYTSSGSIAGIAGNADLDSFFGTADDFKAYGYKGASSGPTGPADAVVQTQGLPAHHEPNLSSSWDWYYDNQEHITLLSKTVGELVTTGPYPNTKWWYQTDKGWVSDAYVQTLATPPDVPDYVVPVVPAPVTPPAPTPTPDPAPVPDPVPVPDPIINPEVPPVPDVTPPIVPVPTPDPTPQPKVIASTLGAAASTVILWLASFALPHGVEIPALVVGAIVTIATFVFGYVTSNK